jgi:hypothetical protein
VGILRPIVQPLVLAMLDLWAGTGLLDDAITLAALCLLLRRWRGFSFVDMNVFADVDQRMLVFRCAPRARCQGARTLTPPRVLAALAKLCSKLMKASQPFG